MTVSSTKRAGSTKAALAASGTEIVTVALRRVNLEGKDNLLSWIDAKNAHKLLD